MSKPRVLALVVLSLLLLPAAATAVPLPDPEPSRDFVTVGPGGFATVQAAIDHAREGAIIKLLPGVYRDPINVDKTVVLMGTPTSTVTETMVVSANNVTVSLVAFVGCYNNTTAEFAWDAGGIVTRQTDGDAIDNGLVSDLRVNNCTFTGGRQGVFLFGAKRARVEDCAFTGNYRGITIRGHYMDTGLTWEAFGNTIARCTFNGQAGTGNCDGEAVAILASPNNAIVGCTMTGNSYPVYALDSPGTVIRDCTVQGNAHNLVLEGCASPLLKGSTIDGSTVTLQNCTEARLEGNDFAVSARSALSLTGNVKTHYNHAIGTDNKIGGRAIHYIYNTADVDLSGITAGAILLAYCPSPRVTGCTVRDGDGLWLYQSPDYAVTGTTLHNTVYGIGISQSTGGRIRTSSVDTATRGFTGVGLVGATGGVSDDLIILTPLGTSASYTLWGGSTHETLNCTFDATKVRASALGGGVLSVYNYLTITVTDKLSKKPVAAAEVNVLSGGTSYYGTPYYGGANATSDASGRIGPLKLLSKAFDHSDTATTTMSYNLVVYAKADKAWNESRTNVDLSSSRTEAFVATVKKKEDTPAPGAAAVMLAVLVVAALAAAGDRRRRAW